MHSAAPAEPPCPTEPPCPLGMPAPLLLAPPCPPAPEDAALLAVVPEAPTSGAVSDEEPQAQSAVAKPKNIMGNRIAP